MVTTTTLFTIVLIFIVFGLSALSGKIARTGARTDLFGQRYERPFDYVHQGVVYHASIVYRQDDANSSNIFNSVLLTGSDSGDLSHYCSEVVTLVLGVLGASGGLSGRVTIV